MTAMAQIVGLFGSAECVKAARSYGKWVVWVNRVGNVG